MDGFIINFSRNHGKKLIATISLIVFILICLTAFVPTTNAYAQKGSSAIVIEESSGRMLYGENIHARLEMASTTKAVTALIVLENVKDVEKIITVHPKSVGVEGSSIYLQKGDRWKIKDLLYGLMLRSGNDSATALAYEVAGSVEKFAELMNKKVADLNLRNTNFTNPHGLHDENHYTSAYDLAMLTREAMKYDLFRKICETKSYRYTKNKDEVGVFINKNKMLRKYTGANGVKTGFTKKAGRCLISSAKREGMQLITVVLNHGAMWADSMAMMSQCYENYDMYKLISKEDFFGTVKIKNGVKKNTLVSVKDDVYYPLNLNEYSKIKFVEHFDEIKAPEKPGKIAGNIEIFMGKHLIFKTNVYTIENIKGKGVKSRLEKFFDKWGKK